MRIPHGAGGRLAAALALVVALAAAGSPEQRLAELERQVAELRAAVAEARERGGDCRELERRIELVAAELEALRLGEAAVEADRGESGLGPAASKVYRKGKGVSIGGYGEMLYQNFAGSSDGKTDRLDLLRGVFYFGYKWNDRWLFNSELEVEHAKSGEEAEGEVALEFAYVERRIRPAINFRAGLLLLPMGLVNELHEPTVFLGARRPGVETAILPTTWRENGFGVFGDLGPISYRGYLLAGLDAEGFGAAGLRDGRQEGSASKAENLGWVARADWTATPGLLAGGSFYWGESGQGIEGADGDELSVGTRIVEGHVDWSRHGLELRGLAVCARLDDVAELNEALGLAGAGSIGEKLRGHYVQAGYDVMRRADGRGELIPFVRAERYDTQAEVPSGFARDAANDVEIWTIGLAWKPFERIVVKADWQDVRNDAGTGIDQFNAALGYVF